MTDMPHRYLQTVIDRLTKVRDTQGDAIAAAAEACAKSILNDKLVFTFGTGHGSFAAMEMYPRTGTVTGFRPMVESSMISFHRVLGDAGALQYRFIHGQEGYGDAIFASHQTDPGDTMLIFSHSGLNAVTLDIAVAAQKKGMTLIAVTSVPHSSATPSRHSCGKRLYEIADIVIDTDVPLGDAGIEIAGVKGKTGATSTSIAIAIGHAINSTTAELVAAAGKDPYLMVSPNTTDKAEATRQNDKNYAELWRRLRMR
ncbi:sugar isomerase domain-containing protein [Pararhodobacter sp.]|uniref:sugar isomerase domain-containing protein n=1 Tax=Pararhodobacter sp. TaxID=2127056 RepID=UPI002AFF7B98|nr:sugar isomerase domain-containing protein [Pararhodobacter sp.]